MLDNEQLQELETELGPYRALASVLAELERRRLRASFVEPDGRGLLNFIRHFWDILEPGRAFQDGWALLAMCKYLQAVTEGKITRLLINVPPGSMKSLLVNVFWPAWEWGPAKKPSMRYVSFSYASHLTERDNQKFGDLVASAEYQQLYPRLELRERGKRKVSNTKTGWKFATSVGGTSTGERGDRVLLDDPHNIKESESDQVRGETVRWFKEAMSNRLNDMEKSVIIVIMQRVHEDDVAGAILTDKLPYVHLMIPMEFEPDRRTVTFLPSKPGGPANSLFWADPRRIEGECFWPRRFPPAAVVECKLLGEHAFCTPGESPVLMADLTMRPIRDVREGDRVFGWTAPGAGVDGARFSKRRSVPTIVGKVTVSRRPVVRITLDSGRVIRCTEDHKWFTGRNAIVDGHKEYLSATVGRQLLRVCDPELPVISQEDLRDAGWLSGFFDAEGSVSIMKKRDHYEPSYLISFTQGAGRNLPLCEKLENVLNKFGFDWGCHEREPYSHQTHRMRHYYLKQGHGPNTYIKFLHIAQPSKWKDRIINGGYGTAFIVGKERVVSIEPDGVETVYGLTTETGNYVVWGLASKNCGQYQQRPEPRGGGLFKREYWGRWDSPKFPALNYVVASLDGAFTEKKENDPCALTVWGCYTTEAGDKAAITLTAWRKHLPLHKTVREREPGESWARYKLETSQDWGLIQWLNYECSGRWGGVDKLLIENKANGHDVASEMLRLFSWAKFMVELVDPGQNDKWARALAVQPFFAEGLIYTLDENQRRMWVKTLVDEMAIFPRGRYDDQVDSTTQALRWMRRNGMLIMASERKALLVEQEKYKRRLMPLYEV